MTLADLIASGMVDTAKRRLTASNSCTCDGCVLSLARHLSRAGKERDE